MPDPDYLQSLVHGYEEEVINEAWFVAAARRLPDVTHRDKLALLAEVERHAAAAVHALLSGYGLVPRDVPTLHALGTADLESGPAADWTSLMQDIVNGYPRYVDEFHALERRAPAADRAAIRRLADHEIATIEFARRELAADPDSLEPIRRYLDG